MPTESQLDLFQASLSGELAYAEPKPWRIRAEPDRIIITTSTKFTWAMAACVTLFAIPGVVSLVLMRNENDIFGWIGRGVFFVFFLVGFPAFGFLLIRSLFDFRIGDYFVYAEADQVFHIPREKLSIQSKDVIGWRQVSGKPAGKRPTDSNQQNNVTEIQLLCVLENQKVVVPVVGAAAGFLNDEIASLSTATQKPYQILELEAGASLPSSGSIDARKWFVRR